MRSTLLACTLVFAGTLALHAQTYTPKTIRFDGAPQDDRAALLSTSGLTPGQPLTKEQIEAGLQKLVDTGSYSDIGYTVDANALTIKLTVSADRRPMKVRYGNFVFWKPEELEKLVEARVPLFHGEMQPEGSLADQVRAALVAIAKDKGIDITVEMAKSGGGLTLLIATPPIVFGNLTVEEVKPLAGPTFDDMKKGLHGQEFDRSITAGTIRHDTEDIYNNAGYLDATVTNVEFSAPRPEGKSYALDGNASVTRNELYHVAAVSFTGEPTADEKTVRTAFEVKPGDTVSSMLADLGASAIGFGYRSRGFLDGAAKTIIHKDATAHTVNYDVQVETGEIYHLAAISVPAELRPAFTDARFSPGVVADHKVIEAAQEILKRKNAQGFMARLVPDRATHTAVLAVQAPRGKAQRE